jgi:uncharacterized protein (DUF2235 family)
MIRLASAGGFIEYRTIARPSSSHQHQEAALALYAFDGTGQDDNDNPNDWAAVAGDTNIFRFFSAYKANSGPKGHTCDYVPGVGTRFGFAGKFIGGAFGAGWLSRINSAAECLGRAYAADDTDIDVIGFSRGAAVALDFVNKVAKEGVRLDGRVLEAKPAIRFVGLFDVVAAFGVANLGLLFTEFNPLHHLMLPANVEHCYHAMSLDERRPSFENQRVSGAYEVWLRGVHSDIGGGNHNPFFEYVALRWMYRKAMLCGLPIIEANIDDTQIHPELPIKPNPLSKASSFWRHVKATDRLHYAVAQHAALAGEDLHAIPPGCPIETAADERTQKAAPGVVTT